MSDGWTGLSIADVTANLKEFDNAAREIVTIYNDAFDMFNEDLYISWASQRAVDFNPLLEELSAIKLSILFETNDILVSAGNAASFMARHNGATFANPYDTLTVISTYDDIKELKDNIDGIVGMNIPLVKMALNSFVSQCENVKAQLESLPMNFSMFDPEGELVAAYREKINGVVAKITDTITSVSTSVKTALGEEELSIILGKAQAEDALSGEESGATKGILDALIPSASAEGAGGSGNGSGDGSDFGQSILDTIGRYGDTITDAHDDISRIWNNKGDDVLETAGAIAFTVAESVQGGADIVVDTAQGVADFATETLNLLFDLGTERSGQSSTSQEYWQHIGEDYAENWDYSRCETVWDYGGATVIGTGRTVIDAGQTVINAADTALDWVGDRLGDAADWALDSLESILGW